MSGSSRGRRARAGLSLAAASALLAPAAAAVPAPPAAHPAASPAAAARPLARVTPAQVQTPTPHALAERRAAVAARLTRAGGGDVEVRVRPQTGGVASLAAAPGRTIAPSSAARRAAAASAGAGPIGEDELAARSFLSDFGDAFGLRDQAREAKLVRAVPSPGGSVSVRFQQQHDGVPVLGGEVVVTVEGSGGTRHANGEVSPHLDGVPTVAKVSASRARATARDDAAAASGRAAGELTATPAQLWIYDPALLGAAGDVRGPHLVWRTEVSDAEGGLRRLVLVDAALGKVSLAFDENPHARVRYVCDLRNVRTADETCRAPYARAEGGGPVALADVNGAYVYTGSTYDYFRTMFGRDGIDGRGMPLRSTVRYCSTDSRDRCPLDNAFWNGSQMVFGDGFASADDVVGHELTHGITERTAGLLYYGQSGAINESFSDVFGEFIDQWNRLGDDSADVAWLLGEDLSIGALRDMRDPTRERDPDRVGSPYWYTGTDDNGGVHSNSGVGNKAAWLIAHGGTFNGTVVAGLGIDRAARIYYEALTHLVTSGSDYRDLGDDLRLACLNLIGTANITAAACSTSVVRATQAVQMDQGPVDALAPAATCPTAGQSRRDLFADDLEDPAAGLWSRDGTGYGWAYPPSDNLYGADLSYARSGQLSLWGDDVEGGADDTMRMTRSVQLPASGPAFLRFSHAWQFWADSLHADGGRLLYSTDDGSTWHDAGALPSVQGYNGTSTALGGAGWTGSSHGWTASRFDLQTLAGQRVRFAFRVASGSGSHGDLGWFVDNVNVYTCAAGVAAAPPLPASVSVADTTAAESDGQLVFTLTRTDATGAASLTATAASGSARVGSDVAATSQTVSFADGEATAEVSVPILQDTLPERPESVGLVLSAPAGVRLDDATATGVLTDDDPGSPTTLAIGDSWVTEGAAGTTRGAAFTITRGGDLTHATTVTVTTQPGTASASDIVAAAPATLTFAPGQASATVWRSVRGDAVDERNETFSVVLSDAVDAVIADAVGTGTIVDDDGPVTVPERTTLAVDDIVLREPSGGARATATFTLVRGGDLSRTASVIVSTADQGARSGADYVPLVKVPVVFQAGQRTRTVGVSVLGDDVPEPPEWLRLTLSTPVRAVVTDASATAVIVDDDAGAPARLHVTPAVGVEQGPGASAGITFTVVRTGSTAEAVSVSWSASNGTLAPVALAGYDFARGAAGTVTIPAGQTQGTALVQLLRSPVFEPAEHLTLTLSAASGATIEDPTGDGTIIDND